MTTHKLISCDSRELKQIPDRSVDLVVTSPPYPMIEMWDEVFVAQDESIRSDLLLGNGNSAFKKMHTILNSVWSECDRVLKESGFACINIGDATRTVNDVFRMYSNHTEIINFFFNHGYSVLPDIHWRKQSNAPNKFMGSGMYPAGAYVTYEHEYILIFRKGKKRTFQGEEKEKRQKSAFFWEERNIWFSDLWEVKGTSQNIKADKTNRNRSAAFPFEIPYRLVNMYSAEGDIVLDPFSGLGTTALACAASQRNSIGVDIDETMSALAMEQLMASKSQLNETICKRLQNHAHFIDELPEEKKQKCYFNTKHNFLVKTRQETEIRLDYIGRIEKENSCINVIYET